MATEKNSVTLTMGYSNTDFTRKYKFEGLSAAVLDDVKANVLALNASIAGGTDDGFADFFRADDYDDTDAQNIIGKCTGIVAAEADETTTTVIDLG